MENFQRQKIDRLARDADAYWATARISWNLGLMKPALFNLGHAVELYLRASWLKDQNFATVEEMEKGLRHFQRGPGNDPHDINAMIGKQSRAVKDVISGETLILLTDGAVRYSEYALIGYGDKPFRAAERFIIALRTALGLSKPLSLFDQITRTTQVLEANKRPLAAQAVKLILNLKYNPSRTRRSKLVRHRIRAATPPPITQDVPKRAI